MVNPVRFADELGMAVDDAKRLIDDIGETNAQRLLDNGGTTADDTSLFTGPKGRTALAVTGTGTAGAVGWQAFGAKKASSNAQWAKQRRMGLKYFMQSPMSPSRKRKLMEMYFNGNTPGGGGGGGGGGGNNGNGGLFSNLFGGDLKMVLGMLVVLAVVTQLGGGE